MTTTGPIADGANADDAVADEAILSAMRHAISLAGRGPAWGENPQVGCVLLDADGRRVAEGWHRGAGTAHAEVDALSQLDGAASGLTAVVTLEPCNHTGRTGPCVDALIAAGVSRVVHGATDPGTESGGGAERLRGAGIDVIGGVLADEVEDAISPWLTAVRRQRPWVTVKWASSLDGRVAAADGTSQWITGAAARQRVHEQRAAHDAIAVGTGTVLSDDPALTARGDAGELMEHQPIPVVIGERLVPRSSRVLHHPQPAIIAAQRDLDAVLADLYGRGIRRLYVEGGPTLASAFVEAGLADEYSIYLGAQLLGGGRHALESIGVGTIADARRLSIRSVEQLGADLLVVARPVGGVSTGSTNTGRTRRRLMFTGIIEELGEVIAWEPSGDAARITVRGPMVVSDAGHGDSIAVSGVCLTVIDRGEDWFAADVMGQTISMSTLASPAPGTAVNLERAAAVGGRLGGHIVQGHIDGTSELLSVTELDSWRVLRFSLSPALAPLVVDKGSVAVDGVSLTVSAAGDDWFEVSLIPETLHATTLGARSVGDRVNIETDILARHVQRMLRLGAPSTSSFAEPVEAHGPSTTTFAEPVEAHGPSTTTFAEPVEAHGPSTSSFAEPIEAHGPSTSSGTASSGTATERSES